MSLFDRRPELKDLILAAINQVVRRLDSQHEGKDVYALVMYPSSGFRDIGISYSTRSGLEKKPIGEGPALDAELLEMLQGHPDLLQQAATQNESELYYEVNACEWDGASSNSDLFSEVNDVINEEYDALYDDGIKNEEICQFFESMLREVLLQVKSNRVLQGESEAFADDVLLGVQFPDSGNAEIVERISKAVNSSAWHERICAGYGEIRRRDT